MCLQNFSASISICENSSSSISETELEFVDCLIKNQTPIQQSTVTKWTRGGYKKRKGMRFVDKSVKIIE